jgi:hypothetical protein
MDKTDTERRVAITGGIEPMSGKEIHPVEFIARILSGGTLAVQFCGNLAIAMLRQGESLAEFVSEIQAPLAPDDFCWTCTVFTFHDAEVLGAYQETIDTSGRILKSAQFFLLDDPQFVPGYGGQWRKGGYQAGKKNFPKARRD